MICYKLTTRILILLGVSVASGQTTDQHYGIFVVGGSNPKSNFQSFDTQLAKAKSAFRFSDQNSKVLINEKIKDKFVSFNSNGTLVKNASGALQFFRTSQPNTDNLNNFQDIKRCC